MQREIGQALYAAQCGEEHPSVKALQGFGGRSVLEIVAGDDGDAYRAVYTVRFANSIYVLHAFQKKSKKGIATPQRELELSSNASARRNWITEGGRIDMKENSKTRIKQGTGNVFRDLGFPNPEREALKAYLTLQIYRIIKTRKLTQIAAGEILGIKQPHVSGLMRGRSGNFSVERLIEFLISLGQDVEITVRPARRQHGEVAVVLG